MTTERFEELETPCLLLDEEMVTANARDMASVAAASGVGLRPHFKTHKCVEIARLQLKHGAVGGTVAKATEAEIFLGAGVTDLLIATTVVDRRKIARVFALGRDANIRGLVDSEAGILAWSSAAAEAGRRAPVLVEVDTGLGRTGAASPSAAVALARRVAQDPHLELAGVLTHGGHSYGAKSPPEVAAIGTAEGEGLVAAAEALRAAGLPCPVVSAGSTPTARHVARVRGVTEIRPGNYIFHDGIQAGLGVVAPERIALTVLATVVARPAAERVILDCGSKTLSSDGGAAVRGFGAVVGYTGLAIERLWEENALLPVPSSSPFAVGDRVRIVPNHACATVNLHDRYVVVRAGQAVGEWRIAARGRVR
jgi:D-serine deaminase-like pyridoxal phosphate-dependent protein